MPLRNILYVDINALDNYISQIDGYTYEEETIVESSSNIKDGKIGVGISKVSAEGKAGKERAETHTRNAKVTDASKLDKVIKYLRKDNELKFFEGLNENEWAELYREDFIEALVTPRFSKLGELSLVAKKLQELSGGEQAKVRLTLMTLKKCNLLVLDEPTNHLDKLAKKALYKAIEEFPGAVLFVSHDADFYEQFIDLTIKL